MARPRRYACEPFPLQAVCLEHWLNHTVGNIVEVECPANGIREHPPACNLRLNGIEDASQRFNYRHNSGLVLIIVCLGFLIEMSPPHRTSDIENIPVVVLPPLSPEFALPKLLPAHSIFSTATLEQY